MAFELYGPADEARLREALQHMSERNATFCLVASDGISERTFYFAIGGVRVIASGPRKSPTVAETLLARGDITPAQYNKVMAAVKDDERRFAEVAVGLQVLERQTLQTALEHQVSDEILDLFFWDGAEIILTEGQPPKSFYEGRFQTAHLACHVTALLANCLERVNAWRATVQRLPTGREVYELTDKGRAEPPGPWSTLLSLLDGSRTAAEAVDRSGLRRTAAFEFLMVSSSDGRTRRVVGNAAQRVTRDQLTREIELLERTIEGRTECTIGRTRLARTLEQVGEATRAAAQWRILGDGYRRLNELDRALVAYSEVVRVMPTDFATRELVIEIHRHRKDDAQVVAHGRPLADLFVRHNLLNRARHLLMQLVTLVPTDAGLRRTLIFTLIGLGERDLALKHLRELARMLEERRAPVPELRDVYIRLLALDPADRAARKRFEEITGIAGQRRLVRLTLVSAVLVLGLLCFGFFYESRAGAATALAIDTARTSVRSGDLTAARRTLDEAATHYRAARSSRHIDSFLAQVVRMQREQAERTARRLAREAAATDVRPGDARRDEAAASKMSQDAQHFLDQGNPAAAHRVLRELSTLHSDTSAARDAVFPLAITALPTDATILVNGVPRGRGTVVAEYRPDGKTVIQVEAPGFTAYRQVVDHVLDPQISVSLHRPLLWTHGLSAGSEASPLIGDRAVYVAGRGRFLTALSLTDGAVLWRVPLGLYSDVGAPPVLLRGEGAPGAADLVVVATTEGDLVAVRADSGDVAWRLSLRQAIDVSPQVEGALLIVATRDGAICAIDRSGTKRWTTAARVCRTGARPISAGDGTLLWIDAKGSLASADAADGAPRSRPMTAAVLAGTPSLGEDDRIWAFSEDDSIRLLSASSGSALRRYAMPRVLMTGSVTLSGDGAVAVGQDGGVARFLPNGDTAFRRRMEETPGAPCAADSSYVYYAGAKGTLSVLDAANGSTAWTYDAGGPISAAPALDAHVLVVVTSTGVVHCISR